MSKHYGLVSTDEAGKYDHSVVGVPGVFHPDKPTPVGGDDDPVSLKEAQRLDKDSGVDLKLVELSEFKVKDAVKAQDETKQPSGGSN